jgi:hypothetical protein
MALVLGIAAFLFAITPIGVLFAFGTVMSMIVWAIAVAIAIVAILAGDRLFSIGAVIIAALSGWVWWTGVNPDQFRTYLLFALIWPCLFAAVYYALEKLFPNVLVPDHKDD